MRIFLNCVSLKFATTQMFVGTMAMNLWPTWMIIALFHRLARDAAIHRRHDARVRKIQVRQVQIHSGLIWPARCARTNAARPASSSALASSIFDLSLSAFAWLAFHVFVAAVGGGFGRVDIPAAR